MDDKDLKRMRAASRSARMDMEKQVGKARASSWGGKPTRRKDRHQTKKLLNKGSFEAKLDAVLAINESAEGSIPFNVQSVNRLSTNKKDAIRPFSPTPWPGVWMPVSAFNKKTLAALQLIAGRLEKYRTAEWLYDMDLAPTRNRERVIYALQLDDNQYSLDPSDPNWVGNIERVEGPEVDDQEDEKKQWLNTLIAKINDLEDEGIITYNRASYFAPGYWVLNSRNRDTTSMLFSNKLGKGFYIIKNKIDLDWSKSNHWDYEPKPKKLEGLDWPDAWAKFLEDPIVLDQDANDSKLKRKILLWRDYLHATGQGIYIDRATKLDDIELFATGEDDEALKASLSAAAKTEIPDSMFEERLAAALADFE